MKRPRISSLMPKLSESPGVALTAISFALVSSALRQVNLMTTVTLRNRVERRGIGGNGIDHEVLDVAPKTRVLLQSQRTVLVLIPPTELSRIEFDAPPEE